MNFLRLAPLLLASVLCATPAVAQSISDPNARLELSGAFIGVNDLMDAVSQLCPGDYGDAPYGTEGALAKLRPFVRAEEFTILNAYVGTAEYLATRRSAYDKTQQALRNSRTTQSEVEACRTLTQNILKGYSATKSKLQGLR